MTPHGDDRHQDQMTTAGQNHRSLFKAVLLENVTLMESLSYPIIIGSGLLSNSNAVASLFTIWNRTPSTIVILIDEVVDELFHTIVNSVCDKLKNHFRILYKKLQHEEHSAESLKTRECKSDLEDFLLNNGCGRDTGLIGIGGGAIGDLCGFVASTFMRGIPFVQIPTTLLAMVDASVGGKTAVNTAFGKNLIGAFHNPSLVLCDLDFLRTLPVRHMSNGMAEVIKSGAIADKKLFEFCSSNSYSILSTRDSSALKQVIVDSLKIKARIVSSDPKESGLRAILNFGHSVGHAVESLSCGSLLHGEAVSIGMVIETSLSQSLGHCSSGVVERLRSCLRLYFLPTTLPGFIQPESILDLMSLDKKNARNTIRIVMISRIGSFAENSPVVDVEEFKIKVAVSSNLAVHPIEDVNVKVAVPGSKSVSNRILVMAALSSDSVSISNILFSDDTLIMITALKAFGVKIDFAADETVIVHGTGGRFIAPESPIFLGNSGTAARFLTSVATLLPSDSSVVLTGCTRMLERPMADLVEALTANGIRIESIGRNRNGFPIRVHGGQLAGGTVMLGAAVSSQFVSSLLIVAPFARRNMHLILTGPQVVSRPYIDMTVSMMSKFGISVKRTRDSNELLVASGNSYRMPSQYHVEGDASSATYPLAIGALCGGSVTVENVGFNCIQGDAKFHTILGQMGCTVTQTECSTTLSRNPNQILHSVDVDLNSMTDSFITLAVCAAVAHGTTYIRNIANQRLKECNRINAVVKQLKKIGVDAGELPDGIRIKGKPELEISHPTAWIDCYNDHRIAMSFAVLSCRISNIVIRDPNCVRKTYVEFWHHLCTFFKVRLYLPPSSEEVPRLKNNVILIGMKGVGKTTLGRIAASYLNRAFIDMDEEFERQSGYSLSDFISEFGWKSFRERELIYFKNCVNADNAIIATGGGIIESPEAIEVLQENMTIELRRNLDDLFKPSMPSSAIPPGSITEIWRRRRPLYESASRLEFLIDKNNYDSMKLGRNLANLIERLFLSENPVLSFKESFFVSLSCSTYDGVDLKRIADQSDAVELRIDLLDQHHDLDVIRRQVSLVRRVLPDLPLIYTLRSMKHGGSASNEWSARLPIIELGIRLGVDFVDIEADLPDQTLNQLLHSVKSTRCTKIIGSLHYLDSSSLRHITLFQLASLKNNASVVKVVTKSSSLSDSYQLMIARDEYQRGQYNRPCIGVCLGEFGALSRITNMKLSPVTHECLVKPAAYGQFTIYQLTQLRISLGLIKPKRVFLFGHPIDHSRSPAMHNAAFTHTGLPHSYALHSATEITNELTNIIRNENFGGASVTMPLKIEITRLVDRVTKRAEQIGSINTLYLDADDSSILIGDNTDFIGIMATLRPFHPFRSALVLGAGGSARAVIYALLEMSLDPNSIYVYNRTLSRAQQLAKQFGVGFLPDLTNLAFGDFDVLVNTLPLDSEFVIPDSSPILKMSPLVFDINYIETALLRQASNAEWRAVNGRQMLIEQAVAQFSLWTGRQAPRLIMSQAFDSN